MSKILPMDVDYLEQGGRLTLLPVSDTQEELTSQGSGDAGRGSGELDLSDYLITRMESDHDTPTHPVFPNSASPPFEDSYMDCSSASDTSDLSSSY